MDLLFNPNGRILRNRFWQGMVILTVASAVVNAGSVLLNPAIGYLTYGLIFPYICVYGKRLHDNGSTAWWVLLIWFVNLIIQLILLLIFFIAILPGLMNAEQTDLLEDIMKMLEQGQTETAIEGIELLMIELQSLFLWVGIVILAVANLLLSLFVGNLSSDPSENKHGPVPGTTSADTFS